MIFPGTKFRHDINGLRAWAVVAVVLYHFGVPGFSGGFVGVDVFFVISGYLMTDIIYTKLQAKVGRTSFWLIDFYLNRAKRIFPALFVLVAVLLCLGWFLLAPPDYRTLGAHAATALTFVSNIQFWREAGYFDAASHEKWLLHTWSLSVEWQFYLVFPLFMAFVWRFSPGKLQTALALGGGFVVSLILSVYLTHSSPSVAFYLLPGRAWEMLAGGLVFLLSSQWKPKERVGLLFELSGFALIGLAIFGFDLKLAWPGYYALLPVCGTALVILAAKQSSVWTHNIAAQKLGLWSYSIYLWHWPIVVALVFIEAQTQTVAVALGLLFSVLLGWVSYTWVEKSSSKSLGGVPRWKSMIVLGFAMATLVIFSVQARLSNGVPGRLSPGVELAASEALNFNPQRSKCHVMAGEKFKACVYGGPNIKVLLVGDSHAMSLVSAVQASLPTTQDGVMAFTYTSCPTIFGVLHENADLKCAEFNEWVMNQISTLPSELPLIIINRTTVYAFGSHIPSDPSYNRPLVSFDNSYAHPSNNFLEEFKTKMIASICRVAMTRPVYLVRPIPEMPFDVPKILSRRLLMGRYGDVAISFEDYKNRHSFVWSVQDAASIKCGANIIDPTKVLCSSGKCIGSFNNRPLYYDDHHLSQFANSEYMGLPYIFKDASAQFPISTE